MRTLTAGSVVLLAAVALASHGCTAPSTRIPTGEWVGSGAYVDYEVVSARNAAPPNRQQARDGKYQTTLKIAPVRAFGGEAVSLAIHSRRGKLLNVPGEETKIEIILIELRTLDNGACLYAVHGPDIDDGVRGQPEKELQLPAGTIATAMAFPTYRGLVLQMQYLRPGSAGRRCVADAFSFEGDRVLKTGRYVQADSSTKLVKVHWVEELRRAR